MLVGGAFHGAVELHGREYSFGWVCWLPRIAQSMRSLLQGCYGRTVSHHGRPPTVCRLQLEEEVAADGSLATGIFTCTCEWGVWWP